MPFPFVSNRISAFVPTVSSSETLLPVKSSRFHYRNSAGQYREIAAFATCIALLGCGGVLARYPSPEPYPVIRGYGFLHPA